MGTTCIHPNQKREIGITKAAASVEKNCIEEENHLKMAA
jgi:hypothetical protein